LRDIQKISQHKADVNTSSLLEIYRLFLLKEKALFTSLNKLKKEDKLYLGFCWIPTLDKDKIMQDVEQMKTTNENIEVPTFREVKDHGIRPPSLFRLNEFTVVF
jgi:vacuolar-type H+-ATPase subunit I/STV1